MSEPKIRARDLWTDLSVSKTESDNSTAKVMFLAGYCAGIKALYELAKATQGITFEAFLNKSLELMQDGVSDMKEIQQSLISALAAQGVDAADPAP